MRRSFKFLFSLQYTIDMHIIGQDRFYIYESKFLYLVLADKKGQKSSVRCIYIQVFDSVIECKRAQYIQICFCSYNSCLFEYRSVIV